jgi:hypothetical protein
MLRALCGFALSCVLSSASAAPPTPPEGSGSAPMRFEWRHEGPLGVCQPRCRVWISAVGYITADTPREFETFARDPRVRGAVLVLDSDGGSVLGTLALGRAIRSLDMITTIGRTTPLSVVDGGGRRRAMLSPKGSCESMCAFVLLAGTRRYVPPEAQVLVHQIWLGKKRKNALESHYSAEELNIVQRDIGRLALYTIEMGGGVELLETALRIPPWEPLYRLSDDELRRMRLTTLDVLFDRDVPKPEAPVASSLAATVGQPGGGRD